jgi:hypothetical protein
LETNDLSQSVLAAISPEFGMQTFDGSIVSWDDETASDVKNSDICPTLVNFIATFLEQRFITIDNLLDEEDVDPFMDDESCESVMTVLINETSKSHMSSIYGLIVHQGGRKLLHIKTGLVLRAFESFYNYFIRFAVILIRYRITDS